MTKSASIFYEIKKSNWFFILVLLVLNLIIFYRWFFDFSYLTAGDWAFHFKESIADFIYLPAWRSFWNFGTIDALPAFYPLQVGYSILQRVGFDYNLLERLFYFWPSVLLSSFSMYFFANRLLNNNWIALTSAVVYSFNTVALSFLASWLTFSVVYALIPLIFLLLFELLEVPSLKKMIIFGLTLSVSFVYEPRVSYVVALLILLYTFYDSLLQLISKNYSLVFRNMLTLFFPFLLVLLLHFFWILPTILYTAPSLTSKLATTPFASYNTLLDSITLHNYAWTGYSLTPFVRGEINPLLFLIPLASFGYLALKTKLDRRPLFFSFVALIGIFLVKQGNAPFPGTYDWLFNNVPTFKIFRESSKFWVLIPFSYSILIGYFLKYFAKDNTKKLWYSLLSITFILLFIWNTKAVLDGNLGWTFTGKSVPSDYVLLKDYFSSDPDYYRILWIPERSRFSFYSSLHPAIGLVNSVNTDWNEFTSYKASQFKWPVRKQVTDLLSQNYSKLLLDSSSIRYIILPYDRDNETFIHYGQREFFKSELVSVPWLKESNLNTSENVTIFENVGYKQHIYSPEYVFIDSKKNKDARYSKAYTFAKNLNISDYAFFYNANATSNFKNNFINFEYYSELPPIVNNSFIIQTPSLEGINYTFYWEDPSLFEGLRLNETGLNISNNVLSGYGPSIKVTSENFNFTNLLPNPSFESGLWKENVGDCNNFDNNPKIGMVLSNDSSEGNLSLELSAQRHIACTSILLTNISSKNTYLLRFDFKTVNNSRAGYAVQFSKQKEKNIMETISTETEVWTIYEKPIDPPEGLSDMSLTLYAYGLGEDKPYSVNRYDNLRFYALPKKHNFAYFFVSDVRKFKTPDIKTITLNPGKYILTVYNAKDDFPLVLGESYDKGWTAFINGKDEEQIPEDYHFVANGFANGWYINKTGNYTITLEYTPQRLYSLGLKVSLLTFVLLLALVLVPEAMLVRLKNKVLVKLKNAQKGKKKRQG